MKRFRKALLICLGALTLGVTACNDSKEQVVEKKDETTKLTFYFPVNVGGKAANLVSEMTEEFFRAVAYNMNATLHLNEAYGNNVHHVIEACFKAFGRALKEAVRIDEKNKDKIVSSKGVL